MKLRVLLVSNQIRGIDAAGGLGDVPVGLAKVLVPRGDIDIRLMTPGFAKISGDHPSLASRFHPQHRILEGLAVPYGADRKSVDIFQLDLPQPPGAPRVICYLVHCPGVFDDGDKNAPDKAVFFSRSVVEFLRVYEPFRVDLIHCNDWHTGLIPVYLKTLYRQDHYLGRVATLYTTHNAGGDVYQGGFPREPSHPQPLELLELSGLDRSLLEGGRTQSLHHNDKFNFSKGGFGFADLLNTVSRRYREELRTPSFAGGLEGLFKERIRDFSGIVNGIDTDEWDPRTDPALRGFNYSVDDALSIIQQRKRDIRQILREWIVTDPRHRRYGETPYANLTDHHILIGVVTRIEEQKAPILLGALRRIVEDANEVWRRVQLAVLGSAGDPHSKKTYEKPLLELAQ